MEWQKPMDRVVFSYNGTMYRVTTDNGDLLVSPKHNVYTWMGNAASFLDKKRRRIISPLARSYHYHNGQTVKDKAWSAPLKVDNKLSFYLYTVKQ